MLKFVNTGIVFQEIPDEVTLAINISNCPCRCPGCHSQYLWQNIGEPLTPIAISSMIERFGNSITCICLMGGDAEPSSINMLARYIHKMHKGYKVAWYSGRQLIPSTIRKSDFDYIKLGPYIEHLGCLKERTTNQRLYKHIVGEDFIDITETFWK
ncbi:MULTISPECIES: anaerobic ribonucleoside-triphosphate reductase activating protein [Prevotellaceae]|nr:MULTISPECIES: anaerobic ribonucleoside-triphosphate reductase activating protein [Prevotellaceae]